MMASSLSCQREHQEVFQYRSRKKIPEGMLLGCSQGLIVVLQVIAFIDHPQKVADLEVPSSFLLQHVLQ